LAAVENRLVERPVARVEQNRIGRYRSRHIMAQPQTPLRPARTATVSARLKLTFGDLAVETDIAVPAAPAPAEAVLPALRTLINATVGAVEGRERSEGREISCRKGCGACCRQLVPISQTERRAIRALVAAQPKPRRKALMQRFAAAGQALRSVGLADELLDPAKRAGWQDRELSLAYFALGLACPFLEDESCSIHPDRPLVCREYSVTSPASLCSNPDQAGVKPVKAPKLSVAARGLENDIAGRDTTTDWVPLALALDGPSQRGSAARTGPDWMQRFFAAMQGAAARRGDEPVDGESPRRE